MITETEMKKEKIRIVVTDSGLGGMSVLAGIEEKLKRGSEYRSVELIYFNSLPETERGYNSMPSAEVKSSVFNEALKGMIARTSPDIILIACNTLSVIYHLTEFSKNPFVPVIGIVDFGVENILKEILRAEDEIILFGTQTTIASGEHKKRLMTRGIDEGRIITVACPGLESEITNSPESENVKRMVLQFVVNAVSQLKQPYGKIVAALCCTHYGYVFDQFVKAFTVSAGREFVVVNPNNAMIGHVTEDEKLRRKDEPGISVRVLSRAFIPENERRSISELISKHAPLSSFALMNYEYDPGLFRY